MVKIRRKKSRSALKACLPIIVLVILGLAWISNTPLSRTLYKDLVEAASGAGTSETKDDTPFPDLKRLNQELLSTFITNTTSVWEAELLQRLDRIRERCGELCTINDAAALDKYTVNEWNASSPFLRQMEVPFDCNTLMMDEELDKSDRLIPRYPPKVLEPYYTLNGLAGIHHKMYFNQTYLDTNASNPLWTEEYVEGWMRKVKPAFTKEGHAFIGYGPDATNFVKLIEKYVPVKDKRVLVIGTENPWVEAAALILGASHVVTLEYGKIVSQHPRVSTLTPPEIRELYRSKELEKFDVVLSFSSLEHPGLGRYGDALNPWGDLLATAKAWCITKPGGYLGLGLPFGEDFVYFNAHRKYGPNRMSLMGANWIQLEGQSMQRNALGRLHNGFFFRKPEDAKLFGVGAKE